MCRGETGPLVGGKLLWVPLQRALTKAVRNAGINGPKKLVRHFRTQMIQINMFGLSKGKLQETPFLCNPSKEVCNLSHEALTPTGIAAYL